MTHKILIDSFGGPEVMRLAEVEQESPGPGEVLVAQSAVGVNFIDTYHRSGLYPLEMPAGLGLEAGGTVAAVGEGVSDYAVGDPVAYCGMPPGAYASDRVVAADKLIRLDDGITADIAAASLLKGMTAWYLLFRSYPVQAGDTVLMYAAAGGVGQIATAWAASLGARVIGVVSTDEKAALAKSAGCSDIVMADDAAFVDTVRGLTGGEGVAAAYDSVGKDTFYQSLDCLRKHGMMVTYGNASGAVEPFAPLELAKRGSLKLTRPVLFDFISDREGLLAAADALFSVIRDGTVAINISAGYALAEAVQAHQDLEARRTTGSILLKPA